ncbi:hypothetical protein EJ03DRAFT_97980 [Teratosphaeria nubilosa]|uniref:Uncharacterized protein n=1 Tax=Teratosphaeria nubilosa TaxID=161662 RepID=A0A6G1LA28_9PEZI|nr:hypothetical protein EJ03DRAFT_97980 [Teratosphaeria nubilosa]
MNIDMDSRIRVVDAAWRVDNGDFRTPTQNRYKKHSVQHQTAVSARTLLHYIFLFSIVDEEYTMRFTILAQALHLTTALALNCGKCVPGRETQCYPFPTCCTSCEECRRYGSSIGSCASCDRSCPDCSEGHSALYYCCNRCGPCKNTKDRCCTCHVGSQCPGGQWPLIEVFRDYCPF